MPRSNTRLLREAADTRAGRHRLATFVPLFAPADQPEDVLTALEDGIRPHLPISVLLLGMGADMHTASLFPGADRLAEALASDAPLLLPMRAEAAGEPRVTLTAPVLQAAYNIHVLITGPEKRAALETVDARTVEEAPVRALLANATVHWAQ